ncbi:hypothetical protein K438DRAFT_1986907 [Mycena galopus ATCC 62051]|nr:hypothetical protein K438DRAFT_1986907 [Mycena galopus ATCC 62051]
MFFTLQGYARNRSTRGFLCPDESGREIQEKSVEYDPDRKVVLFRCSPVLVLVMPGPGNKARSPHITVATCRCRFRATILTLALDAAAQQGTMKIYSSSFRHAPLHGNTPPKSDLVNEGEPRASKRPKSCPRPAPLELETRDSPPRVECATTRDLFSEQEPAQTL